MLPVLPADYREFKPCEKLNGILPLNNIHLHAEIKVVLTKPGAVRPDLPRPPVGIMNTPVLTRFAS